MGHTNPRVTLEVYTQLQREEQRQCELPGVVLLDRGQEERGGQCMCYGTGFLRGKHSTESSSPVT